MHKATDAETAGVNHCVVAGEDAPSVSEMAVHCAVAGHGEELPADYSDRTAVIVNGYLMPMWMAEVLGHIGRK